MKKRTLGILVTAALAAPVSGCVFGTEGELQGGSFHYECSATQFDSACAGSPSQISAVPKFVAVGAPFGMTFQKNGVDDPSYSAVSASPEIIQRVTGAPNGSAFRFQKAGYGAVLARDSVGNVADFLHIQAAPADHIDIMRETLQVTTLNVVVGSKTVLQIQPKDKDNHSLAGGFDLTWEKSGDASAIGLETAPGWFGAVGHGVQIDALAAGKADVTARSGSMTAVVHVIVTGGAP